MEDNDTLDYYERNAEKFIQETAAVDFTQIQDRFLALLEPGGKILDFGCGSGRDARYFLHKGFEVEAADGSKELCRFAGRITGILVRQMLFSELDAAALYDGIWACASILHLPKGELKEVFGRMARALKQRGYLYTSFKYGTYEGYRNGRYFTDFTEASFRDFLKQIPGIEITQLWISADVRPGRSDEKWLNLILQKPDTV